MRVLSAGTVRGVMDSRGMTDSGSVRDSEKDTGVISKGFPLETNLEDADDANVTEKMHSESVEEEVPPFSLLPFLADNAFAFFIIGPLTVMYWRGTWEYLNRHLFEDQPDVSNWICLVLGNVGLIAMGVTQPLWTKFVATDKWCSIRWLLGYHLYTYIVAFLNVIHWRGMWNLLDYYTGTSALSCFITLAIGQFSVLILRCSKCLGAPPIITEVDQHPYFFHHFGRFYPKFDMSASRVLDMIFTVAFIHHMTVFYWRGLWGLLDVYLFPDDFQTSGVVTLIISLFLHATLCILQPLFNRFFRAASRRRHPSLLLQFLEFTIYSLGSPICVTQWRGIWILCNDYHDLDLLDVASHWMCLGVMMLMNCAQSLTMRGCFIDGDSTLEDGCIFPNKYFRYWISARPEAQQQQQLVTVDGASEKMLRNSHDSTKASEKIMKITVI